MKKYATPGVVPGYSPWKREQTVKENKPIVSQGGLGGFLDRNLWSPLSYAYDKAINATGSVPFLGHRGRQNRSLRQYTEDRQLDKVAPNQRLVKLTPWASTQDRLKYIIPAQWYNEKGGLKSGVNQADPEKRTYSKLLSEKWKQYKADAEAHGYKPNMRQWQNLVNTVSTDNVPLAAHERLVQDYLIQKQRDRAVKMLQEAPNDAQRKRRQAYLQSILNAKEKARLEEVGDKEKGIEGLPFYEQWGKRLIVPAATGLVGGLAWKAPSLVATIPLYGMLDATARQGGYKWREDPQAVANAWSTGNFEKLTDKQKALAQKLRQEHNLPTFSADPKVRNLYNLAASKINSDTQDVVNNWQSAADIASMLLPWGGLSNIARKSLTTAGRNVLRQTGAKNISKQLGKETLYRLVPTIPTVSAATNKPQDATPAQVANLQAAANVPMRSQQSGLMNILNAGTFGMAGKIRDQFTGQTVPLTNQHIIAAREALGNEATTQQVLQAANNIREAQEAQRRYQGITQNQRNRWGIKQKSLQAVKNFEAQIKAISAQQDPEKRAAAQQKLLSGMGKQMGTMQMAYFKDALQRYPQLRKQMVSTLGNLDANQLTTAVRLAKNSKGKSWVTPFVAQFLPDIANTAINKYQAGLGTAKDKYQYIKPYTRLFAEFKDMGLGQGSQQAEKVQQITQKAVWDQVSKNPLFINKAMSLWALSNGYDSLGSFLGSNGAFYGTLIGLPLTIALMSSLFGGSKQAPQQVPQQQQYQPVVYVPRGITQRGLIVG